MREPYKQKSLSQLKKAGGMINKIISMIEEDRYCIDILQQTLAANGLLKSANKIILENHLNSCFKEGIETTNKTKKEKLINEVLHIVNKI